MAGRNSCRAGECNRTGAGDPATPSRRIEQLKRIIGSNESGRRQRQHSTPKGRIDEIDRIPQRTSVADGRVPRVGPVDRGTEGGTNHDRSRERSQNPPSAVNQIHRTGHDSTGGQQGEQRSYRASDDRDDTRHGDLEEDHTVHPARCQSEASQVRSESPLRQALVSGQGASHDDRHHGEQPGSDEGRRG